MTPDLQRVLRLHEISEAGHRILDPLTDDQLRELGDVARVGAGTRVLDLACGKGELLCTWAAERGANGVGVDVSEVFVAAARARADELGVTDRVTVHRADASTWVPEPAAYDVAGCVGATWVGGGVPGTIDLLRPALAPGGRLLIGEPFWREPPPAGAAEAVGLDGESFTDLAGLLACFTAAGADLVEMVLADGHSWDRYVAAQWWTLREWLDEHPGDPFAGEVRAFLEQSRSAHLTYQRRYLGWGVFVLRIDERPVSHG